MSKILEALVELEVVAGHCSVYWETCCFGFGLAVVSNFVVVAGAVAAAVAAVAVAVVAAVAAVAASSAAPPSVE